MFQLGSGYLKHVFNVFDRIGYMRGTPSSDWDVLWCHDYPFITLHKHLINMKPHQRVCMTAYPRYLSPTHYTIPYTVPYLYRTRPTYALDALNTCTLHVLYTCTIHALYTCAVHARIYLYTIYTHQGYSLSLAQYILPLSNVMDSECGSTWIW